MIENSSNHLACMVRIENFQTKKSDKIKITSQDTGEKNLTRLKEELQKIDWKKEISGVNVDITSNKFHRLLSEKVEHFTPIVTRTVSPKNLKNG